MTDREQTRRDAPERGYFHVRKEDLHSRSALDADPAFASFDVVLRGDFDRVNAELEQAEQRIGELAAYNEREQVRVVQAERERDEALQANKETDQSD